MKTAIGLYLFAALSFGAMFYQADSGADNVGPPYQYLLVSTLWPITGGIIIGATLNGRSVARWQR